MCELSIHTQPYALKDPVFGLKLDCGQDKILNLWTRGITLLFFIETYKLCSQSWVKLAIRRRCWDLIVKGLEHTIRQIKEDHILQVPLDWPILYLSNPNFYWSLLLLYSVLIWTYIIWPPCAIWRNQWIFLKQWYVLSIYVFQEYFIDFVVK